MFFVRKKLVNGSVYRLCPELISICLDTAYSVVYTTQTLKLFTPVGVFLESVCDMLS